MTGQKQCCATCHFFQDNGMSGSGWCTHPKRAQSQSVKILIRKQELACRNSWGDSLWTEPPAAAEAATDDRLVAQGLAEQRPDLVQDTVRASTPGRFTEDVNTDANDDQAERVEHLRRGNLSAIEEARRRTMERRQGRGRIAPPDTSTSVASSSTEHPPVPAAPTRASEPVGRMTAAPVPASEVHARPLHADDPRFDEVPAVKPDIELPRLRNQFRLPGQKQANAADTTQASDGSEGRPMTAYDLALQKALEYQKARKHQDPPSRPAPAAEAAAPPPPVDDRLLAASPADDAEDEVVHFQVQRRSTLSRFAAAEELDATFDEVDLEDDFELDRAYHPESPSKQSGQRWWQTFGRARVFQTDRRSQPEPEPARVRPAPARAEAAPPAEPAPVRPQFDIRWDDQTLAPLPPLARPGKGNGIAMESWASLDYLDDDPREPLPPMTWSEESEPLPDTPVARWSNREAPLAASRPEPPATVDRVSRWTYRDTPPSGDPAAPAAAPRRSRFAAPDQHEPVTSDEPEPEEDPAAPLPAARQPQVAAEREILDPDFDIRRIVAEKFEPPLDMTITIAPDVPRACATCRHFRASGNGQRGWCTNTWAFPHRPLVNAEGVSCASTIGCWWLPADEEFDQEAYDEYLDQPAPRADRLIAELYGEDERVRRSM